MSLINKLMFGSREKDREIERHVGSPKIDRPYHIACACFLYLHAQSIVSFFGMRMRLVNAA